MQASELPASSGRRAAHPSTSSRHEKVQQQVKIRESSGMLADVLEVPPFSLYPTIPSVTSGLPTICKLRVSGKRDVVFSSTAFTTYVSVDAAPIWASIGLSRARKRS